MIEFIVLNYLKERTDFDVGFEKLDEFKDQFILLDKTSSRVSEHIKSSTFAIQSYGSSLYEVMKLNNEVIKCMNKITELDEVISVNLNNDYNFTDTRTKEYRYQAVFDITHY